METFFYWLTSIALCGTVSYLLWKRNQQEEDATSSSPTRAPGGKANGRKHSEAHAYEGLNTAQLLETVAKSIGCQVYHDKENKDRCFITYQGEHFMVFTSETSPFLHIYDMSWYSAPLDDIDNLSLVRQAINACNMDDLATVLYTIDKKENCVNVHTRQSCIFGPYIPQIANYLRSRFDDSFRQHHNFYQRMENIRKEQYS